MEQDKHNSPLGLAVEWVGRIMAAALMMVLPGLLGQWLDHQFRTSFLSLFGFGIGMAAGIGFAFADDQVDRKEEVKAVGH